MVINAYFAAKKFLILNDLFCQEELDFMLLSEKENYIQHTVHFSLHHRFLVEEVELPKNFKNRHFCVSWLFQSLVTPSSWL